MTKMAIIKFFWILTAEILLIAAFAGLIVCIIVPAIRLLWGGIQDIIQHNRQRKEAIKRYKSENPILKDDLPENMR